MRESRQPILFILTGSYQEFLHYKRLCSENFRCQYVDDEQSIRGYQVEHYICLGNWMRRTSIHYILDILRAKGFKELFSSDISEEFSIDQTEDRRRRNEFEREYVSIDQTEDRRRRNEFEREYEGNWDVNRKRKYTYLADKKVIVENKFEFLSIEEMNL